MAKAKESTVVTHSYSNTLSLFALLAILIGYLNYLQVPEFISLTVKKMSLELEPAGHVAVAKKQLQVKYDKDFLKNYKCDENHGYRIEILKRAPLVMQIHNFLAPGEAQHLRVTGEPFMARSKVSGQKDYEDKARTSSTAFMTRFHDAVYECVEKRAASFANVSVDHLEPVQIVWYKDGQQYLPHFDYFPPDSEYYERHTATGGQRMMTIFVYLNTVPEEHGGHTTFPTIKLDVPAVEGNAAAWYDVNPSNEEDPLTLHGGAPVNNHEKWGANIWIRVGKFTKPSE